MYQHAGDGYGEHKAYQQGCVDGVGGFDALVQKNAMQKQKHGYGGATYQPGCDGVAGYDALVMNKAMQKQAYGAVTGAVHHNQAQPAYGKTYKQQIAGVGGALPYQCESEESDYSSEEESDCEEEVAYGGKHGGNKLGTTHQYNAYELNQQHGGGSHYESYQSTTTQGYSGGGYGW
jgi:hypothetical protein